MWFLNFPIFKNRCRLVISALSLFVVNSILETKEKKFLSCQLHLSHWFPFPTHAPNGAWNECSFAFVFFLCSGTPLPEASCGLILGHSSCMKDICPSQRLAHRHGKEGEVKMPSPLLGLEPQENSILWNELNYREKNKRFIKHIKAKTLPIQVENRMTVLRMWGGLCYKRPKELTYILKTTK